MPNFLNHSRQITVIFGVSLAAGLLACTALFFLAQSRGLELTTLTGDAHGYTILAQNILSHHAFSFSDTAPYTPDSFRAPGYPLFLAVLYALLHSWVAVLFAQALVVSVAPVLLYILLRPYHERAAFWGAIIFALEPVRLFLSSSLLSDALFTCLLLGSLVLLEHGRRTASLRSVVFAAALLGACMLIRPIALFLPVFYIAYLYFYLRPYKRAMFASALLLLVAGAAVFPWVLRNHALFGSWSISSVGAANLVNYNAPEFLKYHPSERGEAILHNFQAQQKSLPEGEALSLARTGIFTHTFREVIKGEELAYTAFHLIKTAPFFVTDGLRDTIRLFAIDIGTMPNISTALLTGNFSLVLHYLAAGGLPVLLLVVGSGFWIIVSAFFCWSIYVLLRRREYSYAACLVAIVLYFALLTGPVSNARYREPVEGILIVGALSAVLTSKQRS